MTVLAKLAEILAPLTGEAYYVGGCVRDCLLGRPIKDVDIAVAADPRAVGEAVQAALGGHFFWLRERDGTARVIRREPEALQIDIVPLAGTIEEDLRRRDYTVNAMAIAVAGGLRAGAPLLDPTGGRADLEARRLRLAGENALRDDPLRALRGVRLSVQLGFSLEAETAARLREAGSWLSRVSGERIRDELFLLLAAPESAGTLRRLWEFGLLAHVLPELSAVHAAGAWEATLAHVTAVERLAEAPPFSPALASRLRERLARPLTPPRKRAALLEFGTLLGRLPPEEERQPVDERPVKGTPLRKVTGVAGRIGQRLALSAAEATWLGRVLAERETPAAWHRDGGRIGRAVYRLWRRAGDAAADAVLIAAADPEGSIPAAALEPLLERLLAYERGEHPPLLWGQEIMAALSITPGPELGRVMDALAEAQADGVVQTREEALAWLAARQQAGEF